jgi:hypothetical protein
LGKEKEIKRGEIMKNEWNWMLDEKTPESKEGEEE